MLMDVALRWMEQRASIYAHYMCQRVFQPTLYSAGGGASWV
jgi:hypothetical protein